MTRVPEITDWATGRARRMEDLDFACKTAGAYYPKYDTFTQDQDGNYALSFTQENGHAATLILAPGSEIIEAVIESAVA